MQYIIKQGMRETGPASINQAKASVTASKPAKGIKFERVAVRIDAQYADKYTISFIDRIENERNNQVMCIGANDYPTHPQGFYQHNCASKVWAMVGTQISLLELPDDLLNLIVDEAYDLMEEIR